MLASIIRGGQERGINWQLLELQMSIHSYDKPSVWLIFQEIKLIANVMYSEVVFNAYRNKGGYMAMPVLSLYGVVMIQCPAEHSPHTVL